MYVCAYVTLYLRLVTRVLYLMQATSMILGTLRYFEYIANSIAYIISLKRRQLYHDFFYFAFIVVVVFLLLL